MTRVLAILGSGETAPNMVKVHRDLLATLDDVHGVLLDTPYGFQENVPQLTEKIQTFFSTSLQATLVNASFPNYDAASPLARESYRETVRAANFIFAGPGSPSYAVKQWLPLNFGELLRARLEHDGVVCFSSAAALTLGALTAPIYEMYKVGDAAHWLEGLNVLAAAGLSCAVVPHYDNAEGGNHDTRFCYLGERRLLELEALLPDDVAIFGVDEHTAAILDLDANTVQVRGRGNAYWRSGGVERVLANGSTTDLAELRNAPVAAPVVTTTTTALEDDSPDALGELVAANGPNALTALARLVALAHSGGAGRIDPTSLVNDVLVARAEARAAGNYALSDQLRDALVRAGIEISDGPAGATWRLADQ